MNNKLKVMYVDNWDEFSRLPKNIKKIKEAAAALGNLELEIDDISHRGTLMSRIGWEDLILDDQSPFPYRVVILNCLYDSLLECIEALRIRFEEEQPPKIIGLYPDKQIPESKDFIKYFPATGGNGHLTPQNAKQVVQELYALSRQP